MAEAAPRSLLDPPTPDEVRAEVDRLTASPVFERVPKLQRFLRYVCDRTLAGQGEQLNEYLLGVEVFERPAGYSPSDDAVVRRQAHALRQKLQQVYETSPGPTGVRITMPVGSYVPVFTRPPAAIEAPPAPLASPSRRRWLVASAGGVGLAAAGFATGLVVGRARTGGKRPAVVEEIWGPWLRGGSVVLCLSRPMTTLVRHLSDPNLRVYGTRLPSDQPLDQDLRRFFGVTGGQLVIDPSRGQGKLGEAQAAVHLASFLGGLGLRVHAIASQDLTWELLRREQVIVLGHSEINPWVDRLLAGRPMRLAQADRTEPLRIVEQGPEGTRSYRQTIPEELDGPGEQVALVSLLPSVDGGRPLLLINGIRSQATAIAAESLTSVEWLSELVQRLRARGPRAEGGWRFQTVLRTEVRGKVPVRAEIASLQVLRA